MKTIRLMMAMVTLTVWSACWAACGSSSKGVPPGKRTEKNLLQADSTAVSKLGQTVCEVLLTPKKVTAYQLRGTETVSPGDVEAEPHYVRTALLGELAPWQQSVLQYALLTDHANYGLDSVRVRSPYVPLVELEYVKKKTAVHVIISLQDLSWSVVYDGRKLGNWNYADKRLIWKFVNDLMKINH